MKKQMVIIGVMLMATVAVHAQQDPALATGLLPYNSFQGGDIDSVNIYNGALNVHIPLIDYPQVGGKLKLSFSFVWSGKSIVSNQYCTNDYFGDDQNCVDIWLEAPYTYYSSNQVPAESVPSAIVDDQEVSFESYEYIYSPQGEGFTWYYQLGYFVTPDGAIHPAIDLSSQSTSLAGQRSLDGTNFFNGNRQPVDYLPNGPGEPVAPTCTQQCYTTDSEGISYGPSTGVVRQDANGNQIKNGSTGYIDTTGRIVPGFSASSTTGDQTGCTGPLPIYAVSIWTPPGINGDALTYKFCYVQVAIPVLSESVTDLQSIVLPNGEAWTFEYNVAPDGESPNYNFGELSKITYPTGGTISYTYRYYYSPTSPSTSLAVSSRTVNDGNGGGNQVWTYGEASPLSASAGSYAYDPSIVSTDPLGNETIHVFDPGLGVELYTQYYDHTDGKVHKTVAKNYSGLTITGNAGALGSLNAFPTTITTTLDNGESSVETRSYGGLLGTMCDYRITGNAAEDSFSSFSITNGSYNFSQNACGASFGKLKEKVVYDYTASGTGLLLSDIVNQYQFQTGGGSGYITANFLDPIASTTVSDSTQRAQTTYGFDETNLGPSGARGNQTSASRWLNTTGGAIRSTMAYDNNGMPTLLTDANHNQTSISYQCGDSALLQVTKAYQSTTTLPETTTYGYDCASGKLTSATDPNGILTNYIYADPLNRLTQVDRAVGTHDESQTNFSYPTSNEVDAAQDQTAKGDGLLKSATIVDGLARVIHKSSPDGSVVDTTYDQVGHVRSVSNPHFVMPSITDGITSYAYDALGRKVLQCQPDNGSLVPCVAGSSYLQWVYSGNVTTSYDELRNAWQRTSDALGRLTNVVEPNGAQTSYTYDTLGNLLGAMQSGLAGEVSRSRSFTYDSLSRLLTAYNPETGTICYGQATFQSGCNYGGYDGNGNLLYKTDARGVTTNYNYDALNRLLGKTYTNDPFKTPSSCYQFDTATIGIGSLGASWTTLSTACAPSLSSQTGTTLTSRAINAYDSMGRLKSEKQCTPANCATTSSAAYSLAFNYDLAGHSTYSDDGIGQAGWYEQYDTSGRLSGTSAVTAWPANLYPSQLFSAQTFLPSGLISQWAVGISATGSAGLTGSRQYDSRFRVTSETESGHE